jgi:hypothetical protein
MEVVEQQDSALAGRTKSESLGDPGVVGISVEWLWVRVRPLTPGSRAEESPSPPADGAADADLENPLFAFVRVPN